MKLSLVLVVALLGCSASAYRVVVPESVQPVEKVETVVEPLHEMELSEEELAYEEEGRALSAQEYDKQAFIEMLEMLLWNADEMEEVDSENGMERRLYHRHGILNMKKPAALKDGDGFVGRMYQQFQDSCYSAACQFGLGGLSSAFRDLFRSFF